MSSVRDRLVLGVRHVSAYKQSHCLGWGHLHCLDCICLLRQRSCQSVLANAARLPQLRHQPVVLHLPHSLRLLQEGLLHLCLCTCQHT